MCSPRWCPDGRNSGIPNPAGCCRSSVCSWPYGLQTGHPGQSGALEATPSLQTRDILWAIKLSVIILGQKAPAETIVSEKWWAPYITCYYYIFVILIYHLTLFPLLSTILCNDKQGLRCSPLSSPIHTHLCWAVNFGFNCQHCVDRLVQNEYMTPDCVHILSDRCLQL